MNLTWTNFDRVGFSLSLICAVHCLAMPIFLPLVPLLADSFVASENLELLIISITFLIATPTLFRGYLRHRKLVIPACFLLGLLFLALRPSAFEHTHDHLHSEDTSHFILAALGGGALALGHWLNLRFCRTCPACKHDNSTSR